MKELQRLIGYINWFRPFVKKLRERMLPITNLLNNSSIRKELTEKQNETVRDIFEDINKQWLLSHPDYSQDFQLYTDASDYGIGGILKQKDKILGYFSSKLSKSQLNYTTGEKELLSIIQNLQHLRNIVLNANIEVYTIMQT
jgi:hypothetical protein